MSLLAVSAVPPRAYRAPVLTICWRTRNCWPQGSVGTKTRASRTGWTLQVRIHGGEYHCYNPDVVSTLQAAVRTGDYETYAEYAKLVNERPVATLRDLMTLKPAGEPVPLEEVEPVEDILPRFDSAGMSLGALSPEAHEALAIAMNRIGGRSNSGEGGEDPDRYGTERMSKIKQVASGRFGVTAEYLVNAEVIADQDRAGCQARRGRPAARPQGQRDDREAALCEARCRADFTPAASRHLFDRGSRTAHLRPEAGQSRMRWYP